VLYLEAEAAGVRATGIGCFFDDPVHEIVGIKNFAIQSLYHFTIGGPVEDRRLMTLSPYEHLRTSASSPRRFGMLTVPSRIEGQARPATSSVESGLSLSLDPEALDGSKDSRPDSTAFDKLRPRACRGELARREPLGRMVAG